MSDSHLLGVVLASLRDEHEIAARRARDGHEETAAHYAWQRDRLAEQIDALTRAHVLALAVENIDRVNAREGYRRLYEIHYYNGEYQVGVDDTPYDSIRGAIALGLDRRS